MHSTRPWLILTSLTLGLAACGGADDTPLEVNAAGLQRIVETTVRWDAEQQPLVESHELWVAPAAEPSDTPFGSTSAGLSADSSCAGASLWLYDQPYLGGNRLCFFEGGTGPRTVELSSFCRALSRECSATVGGGVVCRDVACAPGSSWSGAVRSTWAGVDGGYLSYGGPTGCVERFEPWQRSDTVGLCSAWSTTVQLDRWPSSSLIPTVGAPYDYPSDSTLAWSAIVQGVAHDDDNWYMASQYGLWKLPVDHPLDDHDTSWMRNVPIPPALWSAGYNHFGDPEFSGGGLYVPLEGSGPPQVLVYDSNLNLIANAELSPTGATNEAPWLAIDPGTGLLYTSNFEIRPDNPIRVYRPRFGFGVGRALLYLDYVGNFVVRDEAGTPIYVRDVQGGAFSPSGHLYLVSDVSGTVMGFDASGRRRSTLAVDYTGWHSREELEGLTFWDLDSGRAPNIRGQLHLTMAKRDFTSLTFGSVYFKHYQLANPSEKSRL
jgi:hypothetical protein